MIESYLHLLVSMFISFSVLIPLPMRMMSYYAPALYEEKEASVLFAGDMMFDRSIRTTIESRTRNEGGLPAESMAKAGDFIFSCIDPLLARQDLVVANLEGPITSHASVSATSTPCGPNNFTFTFSPSTAMLLFAHNIKMVNIGNNHMLNFSRDGLLETKAYLQAAGVVFFGDPDSSEANKVARTSIHGIAVAFVNWSDWTSDNTDHTVDQVRKEKESGRIVFVYTHWGDEYVAPLPRVRKLARSFIDAGADMVIGSHPHIVQEHERYRGKDIYYSLGNFIFDQYWDDAVSHGLMLEVRFRKQGVAEVREIPIELGRDRRTCAL